MKQDYICYFPKKSYYPNQPEAMDAVHKALIKRQIVLFEGACGTGKTLSTLVPALHIAKQEKKTVVIATNVHQQMAQFIEEAREIQKQNNIKVVVLKSKMLMCPKPGMDYDTCSLLRDNTYKLIEHEKEFGKEKRHDIRKNSCDKLLEILKNDNDDFRSWLFAGVRTPEEVAQWAFSNNTCGYELLKRFMKEADLLICNYHHLLNEDIRNNVLGWMDKSLKDIIAIFDEAHNIESAARSHSSITLTETTINRALDEYEANKDTMLSNGIETFLHVLLDTLKSTYNTRFKFGERERVGDDWYDLRIADPDEHIDLFRIKLLKALDRAGIKKPEETIERIRTLGLKVDASYERQFIEGRSPVKKISSSLVAASFLLNYMKLSNDRSYYPILSVRRQNNGIYGRLELFTSIPKNVTGPLFNSIHAGVLMSATLAPFETIKTTLGITRQTRELAYGLSFPKKKRLTIAVSIPPLFAKERDNPETKEIITKVLTDIIEKTDGNVLIFFPSFNEASLYKNRLKCNVPVFLDEVGVSAQMIRDEFFKLGDNGKKAVLISYMWGTLTEGVDYKDGRCRTVVIVGVGYPALNDRIRAVEAAYEAEFKHGWDYAIVIPAIRKVRQAMGRVIRSPEDYGARVLLDDRYASYTMCKISWNEVPGKCEDELIYFLEENHCIELEKKPVIKKIKDGVIRIFDGKNSYLLKLNDKKTKAILETNGKRTQEFIVETENGQLIIRRWDSVFYIFPDIERAEIVNVKPEKVIYSIGTFFKDIRKYNKKNK